MHVCSQCFPLWKVLHECCAVQGKFLVIHAMLLLESELPVQFPKNFQGKNRTGFMALVLCDCDHCLDTKNCARVLFPKNKQNKTKFVKIIEKTSINEEKIVKEKKMELKRY